MLLQVRPYIYSCAQFKLLSFDGFLFTKQTKENTIDDHVDDVFCPSNSLVAF